jgi:hypothetical protein
MFHLVFNISISPTMRIETAGLCKGIYIHYVVVGGFDQGSLFLYLPVVPVYVHIL